MKLKAFLKLLLFGIVSLFALQLIFKLLPYYWGNEQVAKKMRYLKEADFTPNIAFVGSSSIQRGIIPERFDSLINNNGKSYNYGSDGTVGDQLFYLLDNLLDDNSIKTIFFELNDFESFGKNRYLTTKTKYFTSISWVFDQIDYINNLTTIDYEERLSRRDKILKTGFENLFKIGYRKDIVLNLIDKKAINTFGSQQGYLATAKLHMPPQNDGRIKSTLNIIKNSMRTARRKPQGIYNNVLHDKVKKYLAKAENSNKNLIFVLSPKFTHGSTPNESYSLFLMIPNNKRIDLADADKFPDLFDFENRFDQMHTNDLGANVMTKHLADEYVRLKNLKND